MQGTTTGRDGKGEPVLWTDVDRLGCRAHMSASVGPLNRDHEEREAEGGAIPVRGPAWGPLGSDILCPVATWNRSRRGRIRGPAAAGDVAGHLTCVGDVTWAAVAFFFFSLFPLALQLVCRWICCCCWCFAVSYSSYSSTLLTLIKSTVLFLVSHYYTPPLPPRDPAPLPEASGRASPPTWASDRSAVVAMGCAGSTPKVDGTLTLSSLMLRFVCLSLFLFSAQILRSEINCFQSCC